jgi:hypothetical protein
MFIIEILNGETWEKASSHTKIQDLERQKQIFIDLGVLPENMRFSESEE